VRTVFGKYCPISGVLASVRAPQAAVLKCALILQPHFLLR
jgi:hypothetical protein